MGTFEYDFRKKHQKTTLTNIHRKVIDYLLDRKIPVDVEKDFPPYQADVYIPSKNIIVEADGNVWHGGRKGNDHDRTRDKVLLNKYKVAKVVRILGTDIQDNKKLSLIIDGIEFDNLIDTLKKNDSIILQYKGKNYKGIVTKTNKFSYTARIKSLNKNINIDKHGLTCIDKQWYRCVKLSKSTLLPILMKSMCSQFEEAVKNKSIDDTQSLYYSVKKLIKEFDK